MSELKTEQNLSKQISAKIALVSNMQIFSMRHCGIRVVYNKYVTGETHRLTSSGNIHNANIIGTEDKLRSSREISYNFLFRVFPSFIKAKASIAKF